MITIILHDFKEFWREKYGNLDENVCIICRQSGIKGTQFGYLLIPDEDYKFRLYMKYLDLQTLIAYEVFSDKV